MDGTHEHRLYDLAVSLPRHSYESVELIVLASAYDIEHWSRFVLIFVA